MNLFVDLFTDYTLRNVTLGAALLGIVSGILGCFAVLRRQGLLGDALAHAALPGVCLAFLATGSKAPLVLIAGAAASGWLGTWLIALLVERTRISEDSALGIVLSTFFGFGIVLLTWIARSDDANQAGLDSFLFGQAATLTHSDVMTMAGLGGLALLVVLACYKEFKLLAFDPAFAAALGFNTHRLGLLLTSLLVVAVVIGLQTVGVVLMAALLIGPAVAARQWTNRLGAMIVISALVGATAGISGALLSMTGQHLPTGPLIILMLTLLVAFSVLFAPARGVLWSRMRRRQQVKSRRIRPVEDSL